MDTSKKRILFLCREHYLYGEHLHENKCSGLFHSATFVANSLRQQGHDARVLNVQDGNSIDRVVTEFDPQVVVLEALWVTPAKLDELLSLPRHRRRRWIVRIHSKLTFLAMEGIAFQWLTGYRELQQHNRNFIIAPNNQELAQDLETTWGLSTCWLPNIYEPIQPVRGLDDPLPPPSTAPKQLGEHINIGCFGAIRPMKNPLAQAMAAVKFANKLGVSAHFFVNAGRVEQSGEHVLRNLRDFFAGLPRHRLIELPWLHYGDFVRVVRTMDIGLQVSCCETFNNVSADFVSNDIPLVGSSEIDWLPSIFNADPTSSDSITDALLYAWKLPGYTLRYLSKHSLARYNKMAKREWDKFLDGGK